MAAFSRGLGLGLGLAFDQRILVFIPKTASRSCSQQCAARITQTMLRGHIIQATRSFQTSTRLHVAKRATSKKSASAKPARPAKLESSPSPGPLRTAPSSAATGHSARTLSLAEKLALKGEPTVLYEAPRHFWFRVSCYSTSLFCISYAVYHYWEVFLHPSEGIHWLLPPGFAVICVLMIAFGGWFGLSAAHIVRRISAVPKNTLPESYLRGGRAKKTAEEKKSIVALNSSPVALEVTLSQILPGLPPKRIIAAPEEVMLPFKMQNTPVATRTEQRVGLPRGHGVIDKIAVPFEAFGRGLREPFMGLRRGLLRDGFASIKVKGTEYKIDITDGKLLENGRILDHLLAYRPNRF